MANTLVTGGAGFIGSHVVNHLINSGHKVLVLDDLSGGFKQNLHPNCEFFEGSITDNVLINAIFEAHDIDYVYHLAAYAAEGLSHFIRRFNYNNNLVGSINLINASVTHGIKCFIFTSSIAVYGTQSLPMRETNAPKPEDPYGIAKYAVEMDLKSAHEMFGLDYIIFRPHNVYGSLQNIGDPYRNVIGIFMKQLMNGEPLTIFGDGEQTRAFTDIKDVAPIIANCIDFPEAFNEVFNVGGDQSYSLKELAKMVMSAMGMETEIRYLEQRKEVKHAIADHSKAESVFGIDPQSQVTLEDGLHEMAAWVKKAGIRKSDRFESFEIENKVPAVWLER